MVFKKCILQIEHGTMIAKKKLKKKIHGQFFKFFKFLNFFWGFKKKKFFMKTRSVAFGECS
jgi:hypothetical protein